MELDRRKLRRRLIGTLGRCSHGYLLQDEMDGQVWLLAVDRSWLTTPVDQRLIGRQVIVGGHFADLSVLDVTFIEPLEPLPPKVGWFARLFGR